MASCAVCRVKTGGGDGARCKKRELCLWLRCYLDFCNNDPFNVNKPPDKPLLPSTVKKSDCQDKAGGARMNATARQRMLLWGSSEFILWSGHVTRIALSRMFPPDHPSVFWLHSDLGELRFGVLRFYLTKSYQTPDGEAWRVWWWPPGPAHY